MRPAKSIAPEHESALTSPPHACRVERLHVSLIMPMRSLVIMLSIAIAAPAIAACGTDACKSKPPGFELDVSADSSIATSARSLLVIIETDSNRWRKTFNLDAQFSDGSTSIAVDLDPAPTGDFAVRLTVEAYTMNDGTGQKLASSAQSFTGAANGCNRFPLNLGSPSSDGGVNPGPDGGPNPFDGGPDAGVTYDYAPSNFDRATIGAVSGAIDLNCPTAQLDTDNPTFSMWCGQPAPSVSTRSQANAPSVLLLASGDLRVRAGTTLRIFGSRAVVFAVFGNALIEGTIDASGVSERAGAGGSNAGACGASTGGNGASGLKGGGGGGYGGSGATGGEQGGAGGGTVNEVTLVPLRGGCSGGAGGGGARGGGGGGAVQISAALTLDVPGRIFVGGGGGGGGGVSAGGGGGGSGGAILLEAHDLEIRSNSDVASNGGGGGGGGGNGGSMGAAGGSGTDTGGAAGPGAGGGGNGGKGGAQGANPTNGENGRSANGGGGGGGGGVGRIRFNASQRCVVMGRVSPSSSEGMMCH
jgi:hypothetical protein